MPEDYSQSQDLQEKMSSELVGTEVEDTLEEAEKIALEVLSPRPPPDDIGLEELAALVSGGNSGSCLVAPPTPSQISRADNASSSHEPCNKSTSELGPLGDVNIELRANLDSPAKASSEATPKKLRLLFRQPPLWRRIFSCVTVPSTKEAISKEKVSSVSQVQSSPRRILLCACFSTPQPSNSDLPLQGPIVTPLISVDSQADDMPLPQGNNETTSEDVEQPICEVPGRDVPDAQHAVNLSVATVNVSIPLCEDIQNGHAITMRPLLPPVLPQDSKKKCFVIDLDETLVHSSFAGVPNPDFKIRVDIAGRSHQVYVLKRPFVDLFLQKMAPLFECVLFTASLSEYADPVTDFLDPEGVFRHRLFRESCCLFNGNYVKDLSQLGRDVNQTVILDNSPVSYLFHPANAVHILTWFDNAEDRALLDLVDYFERLAEAANVPEFLSTQPPPSSAVCGVPPFFQPVFHNISVALHHTTQSSNETSHEETLSPYLRPVASPTHPDNPITSAGQHGYQATSGCSEVLLS